MTGSVVGEVGSARARARPWRMSREVVAGLVLLLVGGAGVAGGVAIDRMLLLRHYGAAWTMEPPSEGERQAIAQQLTKALDLTTEQQAQVDAIIARQMNAADSLRREYQPRVRALMLATRAAIDSILTPAQREKLRALSRRGGQT
jgi:Spy/CpxP family protein refolding chaperone